MAKTFNLKRIRLINFHNFVDETIEIDGHLFLIGGNGSGKTTVLDAVHFVLTAGRRMELNAAARMAKAVAGHGRKIQGIFLRYDVEKGRRNPDDTIGYAALEFENPDNGKKFCIGCGALAISMESQPLIWGFESSGRLEDLQLVRFDEHGGMFPLGQDELKATGTCRVMARDSYIIEIASSYFNGRAHYQDTMNLIASGKSYRELVSRFSDQSQLFRALLPPPDETDYEKIRDSLKDIEQIQQQIERQQARIDALRDLEKRQEETLSQRERVGRMRYIVADTRAEQTRKRLKSLEDDLNGCAAELRACLENLQQNEIAVKETAGAITAIKESDAYRNTVVLQNLQSRLADLRRSAGDLGVRIEALKRELQRLRQRKDAISDSIENWWQQLQACCERLDTLGNFGLKFARDEFAAGIDESYQAWLERARDCKRRFSDDKAALRQEISRVERSAADLEKRIARLEKQPDPVPPAAEFEELQKRLQEEKIEFVPFYRLLEKASGLSDGLARVIEELIGPENLCAVFATGSQRNRARAAVIARPFNIPVIDTDAGVSALSAPPVGGLRSQLQFNAMPEAAERFAAELLDDYRLFSSDEKLLKQAKGFAVSSDGLILQNSALRRVNCDQNRYIGSAARARTRQEEIDRLRYAANSENMELERLKKELSAADERLKAFELQYDDLNRLRPRSLVKMNEEYLEAAADEKRAVDEENRNQASLAGLEAEIAGCERQIAVCLETAGEKSFEALAARLRELETCREDLEKRHREILRCQGRLDQQQRDIGVRIEQTRQQLEARTAEFALRVAEMQLLRPGLDEAQLRDYVYITRGGRQIKPENCEENLRQAELSFTRHHTDLKNCIDRNPLLQKDFHFSLDDDTLAVQSSGKDLKELAAEHEREHEKNREILSGKNRDLFENLIINNIVRRLWQEEAALEKTIKQMNRHLSELKFGNTVYHFSMQLRREFREFRSLVHGASIANEDSRRKMREFFEDNKQAMIREGSELPDFLDYRKWYDVVLKAKTSGQTEPGSEGVELSQQTLSLGSGGEQSVPNYLLLLSLAKVHLDHTAAKIRILLIDEAFYGIDAQRRDELLSFADSIGLNLVIAHPDLDGVTRKLAKATTLLVEKTPAGDIYLGEYRYSRRDQQQVDLFSEPEPEAAAEIIIN